MLDMLIKPQALLQQGSCYGLILAAPIHYVLWTGSSVAFSKCTYDPWESIQFAARWYFNSPY